MSNPDNSRIRELEAEILALRQELERQTSQASEARARADSLADACHDLVVPLSLIAAPLEGMLSVGALPAHMRQGLRRMQRNAMRMGRLLDQVLWLARALGGALVVQPEPVDVARLLFELVDDARGVAKARGLALTFRCEPESIIVRIDGLLVERMVLGLLGYSLERTPRGGSVAIALLPGHERVEVRVTDTGPALQEDECARMFERLPGPGERGLHGHADWGPGLAVVGTITRLMGGEITAAPEGAAGTTFTARVPAEACADEPASKRRAPSVRDFVAGSAERVRAASARDIGLHADDVSRPRMLLVEDDEEVWSYMEDLFADELDVVAVMDSASALAAVQARAFEVVIADIKRPEESGYDIVRAFKQNPLLAHIPLILITAPGASQAALGLDMGADDHLTWPLEPAELRARVHAARRTAELQRRLCDASYRAGMAEMASELIHEVGGAMARVNKSLAVLEEQIEAGWAAASLDQLVRKLEQKERGLDDTRDIFHLPVYLNSVARQLASEQQIMAAEVSALKARFAHIAEVVHAQNDLAQHGGVTEMVVPGALIDAALELCADELAEARITVQREEADMPPIGIDRPRVVHILAHLIDSARKSLIEVERPDTQITIKTQYIDGARLVISVTDNGQGLDSEALARIFEPGSATGRGIGFYAIAEVASELGGTLLCESQGPGQGATFTLELPFTPIAR